MDEEEDRHIPAPAPKHEHIGPDYHKERSKLRRWLIYAVALVLVIAIGATAYLKFGRHKSSSSTTNSSSQQSTQPQSSKINSSTKNYSSSNFNLAFDYPSDWTLSDVSGSGKLTVTSPSMQLKDTSGQTTAGQVVMTIRDKTQKLTEFDKGNALATADSQKVAYTKPAQTQRGSTYLSFLRFATSSSGLDGVYITGDNGYKKDQAIPLVDIAKVDPVVSVTFQSKDGKTISVSSDSWNDTSFSEPLIKMLESLSIS
jgi:cytoskeletal protein RodZ